MPRNISFSLTTKQFRDRTKTVTRRLGWKNLKRGDILNACVKCMGLKPGEKIERLGQIRVVDVSFEKLIVLMKDEAYGKSEAIKEGFPELDGIDFALMFCKHQRPSLGVATTVTSKGRLVAREPVNSPQGGSISRACIAGRLREAGRVFARWCVVDWSLP